MTEEKTWSIKYALRKRSERKTTPKAHVLHCRPNAVLTTFADHLDARYSTYAVTDKGVTLCGYRTRSAKTAWADASRALFFRGESWTSQPKE